MKTEKGKTLISIIVTVYNSAQFIRQCVDSLLNQTCRDLEIILVDGGSVDDTGIICDEYAVKDTRIRVIHKENKGVTNDRKAGVKAAKGDYLAFVDGDDWTEPEMYRIMLDAAIESGADIVTSGVIRESADGTKVLYDGLEEGVYECGIDGCLQNNMVYMRGTDIKGIYPGLWNKLYKREIVSDNILSMDDRIIHNEDEALTIAAVLDSGKLRVLHQAFYHYRIWKGASTNKKDEIFFERFNCWFSYLKNKLAATEHEIKLEKDIDRLALDQIVWGMETQFEFLQGNVFPRYVFPKAALMEKRVVIYGAGLVGRSYYRLLVNDPGHEICGWVDKFPKEDYELVKPVEAIKAIDHDVVIIAVKSIETAEEIRRELEAMGVEPEKIRWFEPQYVLDSIIN